MKPILLFDIDGTLLRVKKPFMQKLLSDLISYTGIKSGALQGISFAGRTDKDIFGEIASHHPKPEFFYDELKRIYLEKMNRDFSADDTITIPGAAESAMEAANRGLHTGLCTGNFREAAFRKVEAAGLNSHFRFGGFGCRHADRIHLPEEASREYSKVYGTTATPKQFVIIGDTPNDIRCAKYFGATSVAVATGRFTRGELAGHQPDLLLTSLNNLVDKVLAMPGFYD